MKKSRVDDSYETHWIDKSLVNANTEKYEYEFKLVQLEQVVEDWIKQVVTCNESLVFIDIDRLDCMIENALREIKIDPAQVDWEVIKLKMRKVMSGGNWVKLRDRVFEFLKNSVLGIRNNELLKVIEAFHALGWTDFLETICSEILFREIYDKVTQNEEIKNVHSEPVLDTLLKWLHDDIIDGWLKLVLFCCDVEGKHVSKYFNFQVGFDIDQSQALAQWKTRLDFLLLERFTELRTSELFDIIRGFMDEPSSIPAIHDLKYAIEKTFSKGQVAQNLQKVFRQRLMHPGAMTDDILTLYILSIHALKELDPSGEIFLISTRDLKQYVNSREDTLSCLVKRLVSGDEFEPLNLQLALRAEIATADLHNDQDPFSWEPNSSYLISSLNLIGESDVGYEFNKNSKLFSLLLHLCNSDELFVAEYRRLLEFRLLNLSGFDVDHELAILELLKMKFGESNTEILRCQVIVNDIQNSRRIRNQIAAHDEFKGNDWFFPKIISRNYWPGLEEDVFKLPEVVEQIMKTYGSIFQTVKVSREIVWKHNLGLVTLRLFDENGHSQEVTCNPLQATILLLFSYKCEKEFSLFQIAELLEVLDPDEIANNITFWVRKGIISQNKNPESDENYIYKILEPDLSEELHDSNQPNIDFQVSNAKENESKLDQLKTKIIGLCQLNGLTLRQLHNLLIMSIQDSSYHWSELTLKEYLDAQVQQGAFEYSEGKYRVAKQ
jgi:anaphase-promoting complex subunit 2